MHWKRFVVMMLLAGLALTGCSQQQDPLEPQTDSRNPVYNFDKDGTEGLGDPSIAIADGSGFAEGGVGMVGVDSGTLNIDVPLGATINQVLLYWEGGTTGAPGDDTITVDGNDVTGDLIGGPTNFFSNYFFSAFRADITDRGWVVPGANSFTITGFDFDFTGGNLDENNGTSMLVIYDDGTTAELSLRDGLDMAYFNFSPTLDATVPQTFTFAAESADRTADLVVFAGSVGMERPNQIKVTTIAGDQIFTDILGSMDALLWDSMILEVLVPAGATELTVELISTPGFEPKGASMAWVGTGLAVPVTPPELLCIGDFVWFDENGNGCQDVDEMGVEGVEVKLWTGCPPEAVIATTVTAADGSYSFCELEPGDYTVQFVAPDGYIFCEQYADGCDVASDSNPGADGITDCVTLVDADDLTIDAGLCLPQTFCIGDFVWFDENGNGCQDVDEMGVENVEVNLWAGCPPEQVIATTFTNAMGKYEFCELMPGDYTVQFVAPAGYFFCEPFADGCDPTSDSNAGSNGITDCVTIVDADDLTIDAALCVPEEEVGCRMTGGGNDDFVTDDGVQEYTFGGQAGAPLASQPQPWGNWTHHQKKGPAGSFVFHAGTPSAPEGTEIDWIECMDPGWCVQARPAPAKQLDFAGVGTFKNMKGAPASITNNVDVGSSLHWFEVNIDDLGEPGGHDDPGGCDPLGFGRNGGPELADCECPDFYRIRIYEGPTDGSAIMYEVFGYIDGGNFQIHPPTGRDSKVSQF
jgi:hypothetical protein